MVAEADPAGAALERLDEVLCLRGRVRAEEQGRRHEAAQVGKGEAA